MRHERAFQPPAAASGLRVSVSFLAISPRDAQLLQQLARLVATPSNHGELSQRHANACNHLLFLLKEGLLERRLEAQGFGRCPRGYLGCQLAEDRATLIIKQLYLLFTLDSRFASVSCCFSDHLTQHIGGVDMQDNASGLKGILLASALNAVLWTLIAGAIITLG